MMSDKGILICLTDLLVANGNSIMFFLSSSNVTENISLTTAPANVKDQKTRIKWIASDEQNDMIYFSSVQTNRVKISSHNLITNRTTEIYSSKYIQFTYLSVLR